MFEVSGDFARDFLLAKVKNIHAVLTFEAPYQSPAPSSVTQPLASAVSGAAVTEMHRHVAFAAT